jgi:hypothetical protein
MKYSCGCESNFYTVAGASYSSFSFCKKHAPVKFDWAAIDAILLIAGVVLIVLLLLIAVVR